MSTPEELKEKFWKAVKSDRTMMLGLAHVDDAHTRPMTAMLDDAGQDGPAHGPIWFFSSVDTDIVRAVTADSRAVATFADKGHGLFACVHGRLVRDDDRAVIERLWNPFIAAWYEGGKTDPKLALLRFDAEEAQIWHDGSSLLAGVKMLLGIDPKQSYRDHVASVRLT
ncbi:pyridoxamine 5'-phosphate oxidase family protein [Xinfangfangia pollutisoli]|uniref:pyridoxamine 5'-phosphate oxidase family protein n=1 Tax=Xinfangfangia pollutisoli TaxID=2865960 RepID=UPI001CD2DA93|nr:pyridoxamine 5'-phosphate oxidase family protein [Xinfangfangia pollutisoli]